MTVLVALVSSGKGSWGQINNLLKLHNWDKVFLVCNSFSYEKFDSQKENIIKIKYDENNIELMFNTLSETFRKEIKEFEVALNISSGTGIEHMCLVSSLLKAGIGVRFVYSEFNELKEFELTKRFNDSSDEEEF